jgi:nucleotide-binding universal stress UspA family protein
MGWSDTTGLRARLFGTVIDSVFWASHCPVAVTRLLVSPSTIQKILVPIDGLEPSTWRILQFAQVLATINQGQVTLFHVFPRGVLPLQIEQFKAQVSDFLSQGTPLMQGAHPKAAPLEIATAIHDDIATAIVTAAQSYDLVLLHAIRQRTAAGLVVRDGTTQVIGSLNRSLIILGEPRA